MTKEYQAFISCDEAALAVLTRDRLRQTGNFLSPAAKRQLTDYIGWACDKGRLTDLAALDGLIAAILRHKAKRVIDANRQLTDRCTDAVAGLTDIVASDVARAIAELTPDYPVALATEQEEQA